jgi:hypothetical protein
MLGGASITNLINNIEIHGGFFFIKSFFNNKPVAMMSRARERKEIYV